MLFCQRAYKSVPMLLFTLIRFDYTLVLTKSLCHWFGFILQIFLVRREASQKTMVLAVRLPDQLGEPHVRELPIKEEKSCEFYCIEK